jgi:hypothetical protein
MHNRAYILLSIKEQGMRGVDSSTNNGRNLKFDNDIYHATMWISTKGLLKDDEDVIVKKIKEKIKRDRVFYGFCFGKFDLIVEFKEKSAKVASNIVCDLQEEVLTSLRDTGRAANSICSSLTLGRRVLKVPNGSSKESTSPNRPVRIYTFLRAKAKGLEFKKIGNELKSDMELFWNPSSYPILLTVSGTNFNQIFERMLNFRHNTGKFFSESCTYVGLDWKVKEKNRGDEIKALTFVKLSSGYGPLELKDEDLLLGWSIDKMEKRLGWYDISLEISKPTLRGIKEAILDLRKNHHEDGDILSTSTLLLPQRYEHE